MKLKPPFPYFGGKSSEADVVWQHFGSVHTYIEPFCGSAAMLLARPDDPPFQREIVNDFDGNIANFWHSVKYSPEQVAEYADWPVNHIDMHARRKHLMDNYEGMRAKLLDNYTWHDPEMAGLWVWCMSCWIGGGLMTKKTKRGICGRPHITHHIGIQSIRRYGDVKETMLLLSKRLYDVQLVCGDWEQVLGGNWQTSGGNCAIFFDPPYSKEADRDNTLYTIEDSSVAHEVRKWCIANGDNPKMRIALCGYDVEHKELERLGWRVHSWKVQGGYANQGNKDSRGKKNKQRECIWFSPHCDFELTLF